MGITKNMMDLLEQLAELAARVSNEVWEDERTRGILDTCDQLVDIIEKNCHEEITEENK